MKRMIRPVVAVAAMLLTGCMFSCTKENAHIEIQLNVSEVTLSEGQTITLIAGGFSAEKAADLVWSSLDPSVATVEGGNVTALSAGETYVLATIGDVSKGCHVTVFASVAGIALDHDVLYMSPGESAALTAVVSPENARNQGVVWKSSDTSVATVDEDGHVEALAVGSATVSVITEDGGHTATCEVRVMTMPENVTVSPETMTLNVGESQDIIATVYPIGEFTRSDIIWTSTDPRIASVDENGRVTGAARGNCNVVATTVANGISASCRITVISPVTGISMDRTSAEMYVGDYLQLTCIFTPADASNQNLSWHSSDTDVVLVSDRGVVTAVALGTSVITATSEDGGFTAECRITVKKGDLPVKGVSLNTDSIKLVTGNSYELIPTVSPVAAGNKAVKWSSDSPEVASVDEYGRVIAGRKAGTAVITVETEDGGFTATCTVTVVNYSSGLPGYDDSEYEWKD